MRRATLGAVLALAACGGGGGGGEASEASAGSTQAATTQASEATSGSGSGLASGSSATGDPSTGEPTTSTTSGPTTGTSDATTGGPPGGERCAPWPEGQGPVVAVTPAQAADLPAIVAGAASGTTIALAPGTYDLSFGAPIHVTTPGLTIRGQGGDRDAVILDAAYGTGELLLIEASDTTIVDLTLQRAFWHPIHVTGGADAEVTGVTIYNVKVIDPGQQAIKINASPAERYADEGLIACSWIELTDAGRPMIKDNCYTGGVDAHSAWGWTIRDNTIRGFWCEQGLSEHAVHMWVTCRDTIVERNDIRDCARGVGFGLGENGNGKSRVYPDDPCPGKSYLGHIGGEIRNNMIWAGDPDLFASQAGFDSGVALEQACDARVVHNTVVSLQQPFVSMEYRWANTSATFAANLVSHNIALRDGAQAQLDGNIEGAGSEHFADPAGADLHLAPGSPAADAAPPGLVADDFDAEPRGPSPDVGADERGP